MNTIDRVKAVIGDVAGIAASEIGDDQNLGELRDFDSLNWTEVVLDLEKHFGIDVADDVIADGRLDTAAKIAEWVEKKVDLTKPLLLTPEMVEETCENVVDTAVDILADGAMVAEHTGFDRTNIHYRSKVQIEAIQFTGIEGGATLWACNPLDMPDWLHEATSLPQGSPGSIWIDFDVPMVVLVGPTGAPSQINEGDWVWRSEDSCVVATDGPTFEASFEPVQILSRGPHARPARDADRPPRLT